MHPRLLNVTPDFPEDRTGFDPQAVLLMQCVFGHTQNRLNKAISPSLHSVNFDSDYLVFSFLLIFFSLYWWSGAVSVDYTVYSSLPYQTDQTIVLTQTYHLF